MVGTDGQKLRSIVKEIELFSVFAICFNNKATNFDDSHPIQHDPNRRTIQKFMKAALLEQIWWEFCI